MLTAQQKAEAEKKLKDITEELELQQKIKDRIKASSKTIQDALAAVDPTKEESSQTLARLANIVADRVLELEKTNRCFADMEQHLKKAKEKRNKEKMECYEEKEQFQASIKDIKETIQKIQTTVKDCVEDELKKRNRIEEDLEKSLDEIRQKIATFEKETIELEQENVGLRKESQEAKGKLNGLEENFKKKAEEKDEEVKAERDGLLDKLKELEAETAELTALNKEYSAVQKKKFDSKLSLYLRTKKFPEYSIAFENSAQTINSCKDELLKGVQMLKNAKEKKVSADAKSVQLSDQYLLELKKVNEKQTKLKAVKKDKQVVRERILNIQLQLKEKNAKATS